MTVRVDSLSVVPGSFCVYDVPDSAYSIDAISATLYIRDSSLLGRSLLLSYSVYEVDFSRPVRHRSMEVLRSALPRPVSPASSLPTVADLMDEDQLYSTGSLARGVMVGTNSDLVLNSSLNLQLSGKLSEDVSIVASVTDKNIPVQPEGTTQNVQDINSIFINLYYKDVAQLRAGDLEMTAPKTSFLTVSRSLLGLDCSVKSSPGRDLLMSNVAGGGVAKGKFVRQSVTPQNGVQGPYKLYGKDNETNIVVLAGSERVYVDGVLLKRGQDNDYVMDYNTAELTFTPSMLVTSEKRIVIEMEYADRHYVRYNIYTYNELLLGKKKQWKVDVNFYQEQDLKNQAIQPELTDAHKLYLSGLGDDESAALYHSAEATQFSNDKILYCRKDTAVDGLSFSNVYVYSTDPQSQLYSLSFTYMGKGKGNYVLLRSATNGRVFGWVAPINGECLGEYEPVVQLATPKLLQVAAVSAAYLSDKGTSFSTELAVSNSDKNTFSKLDDHDNVGFAYSMDAHRRQWVGRDTSNSRRWQVSSALEWQFVHKNFSAVQSFREVEFARNYNLSSDFSNECSEQMLGASLTAANSHDQFLGYGLNWFSRIGNVSALRQELNAKLNHRGFSYQSKTSYLLSRDTVQTSDFWKSDNKMSFAFRKMEIGVTDLVEHNVFKDRVVDTIRANSYSFNEFVTYLKNRDSAWCNYNLSYKNRLEFSPSSANLLLSQRINEVSGQLQIEKIRNQLIALRGTYRNQQLLKSERNQASEHFFVGNAEYQGRFLKNAIFLNTYYEAGTGLELEKSFTFLRVAKGQGTHVWIDYNGDGVEDLGEFEVAAFQDEAEYVKVWLSGTDYRNTYNSQFTQSVQIRPSAVWRNAKGFKRFVARFSDVAMYRSLVKQQHLSFDPFDSHLEDTNMVSKSMNFNNTLSFNNSSSAFAFDVMMQASQNKSLLYYGYEYGQSNAQQLVLKSSPCKVLYLQVGGLRSVNSNASEGMEGRDYRVIQYGATGEANLQFQNKYVAELSYDYRNKSNVIGQEAVVQHTVELSLSAKMAKKGVLTGSARYIGIRGNVDANGPVAYALLQGLNVGNNAVWGISYQMALSGYLQVSMQYDGRVSEGHGAVHYGSLTVKAQF